MDPGQIERDVEGCLVAHHHLLASIEHLTDDDVRNPSALPGWTLGHVLTHLARNADGLARMLEGAARGEQAPMYDSWEARTRDIDVGAGRPASVLRDDVRTTCAALEVWLRTTADRGWEGTGITLLGPVPVAEVPWRRRREVVVHESDLGLGAGPADWPADFVRVELGRLTMLWASRRPMGMTDLPAAALALADHQRLAWLLGRITVDGLEPAGVL